MRRCFVIICLQYTGTPKCIKEVIQVMSLSSDDWLVAGVEYSSKTHAIFFCVVLEKYDIPYFFIGQLQLV